MANFVENKDMTLTRVKTAIKAEVMDYIEECLIQKYGEDSVHYVRNGSGDSKTKELAVRIGTVDVNGEEYEAVACVNASAKDYREHTSSKGKVYSPYCFNVMAKAFDIYMEEKQQKVKDAKSAKEKKIAKDSAARAKKAAETNDDLMDF